VAKIAIVGSRIASTPGLAARMFTALARVGVNIDCISTSEMKVSCVIRRSDLDSAVRAVHGEFFGTGKPAASRPAATPTRRPSTSRPARKAVATKASPAKAPAKVPAATTKRRSAR
jgi:aspartate kinase